MSPADAQAVNHIATDIRDMSDADLNRLARKNACLPGVNAAAIRHEVDKEIEGRQAERRAASRRCDCPAWHPDNDHTEAEHTSCSGYHRCGGCDDCVSAIAINSTGGAR